jgi:predicted Zn finger-like uncharacterized protein
MEAEIGDLPIGVQERSDSPAMILTCPQCATRYFLPDFQVGREGRAVKCTTCGKVWRQEALPDPEPLKPHWAEPEPDPESFPDPEEEFAAAAQRRAEILRDKKAAAERRSRQQGVINAAISAGLVAAIALAVVLAIIFRIEVVKVWPGAATAYAAIGMPVNASGLLIDKVQAAPAIAGGRRTLNVTGVVTNASAAPRPAPAFRVSVLDASGKTIMQKVIQVPAQALKVGEARKFLLQVADPPPGAKDVYVTPALPEPAPAKAFPPKPVPAAPVPAAAAPPPAPPAAGLTPAVPAPAGPATAASPAPAKAGAH